MLREIEAVFGVCAVAVVAVWLLMYFWWRCDDGVLKKEDTPGFEPETYRTAAGCSTTELYVLVWSIIYT